MKHLTSILFHMAVIHKPQALHITVEPRYYGHQGDTPKCPYHRGVHIKRVPRKKVMDTCFIDKKTMAGIFYGNKTF